MLVLQLKKLVQEDKKVTENLRNRVKSKRDEENGVKWGIWSSRYGSQRFNHLCKNQTCITHLDFVWQCQFRS